MNKERKLSAHIEGKFEAVGVLPGAFIFKGQNYDHRTMTVAVAEQLVKDGCPYLKKKETPSKASGKS